MTCDPLFCECGGKCIEVFLVNIRPQLAVVLKILHQLISQLLVLSPFKNHFDDCKRSDVAQIFTYHILFFSRHLFSPWHNPSKLGSAHLAYRNPSFLVIFFFADLLQNSFAHPPYGIRSKFEATRLVELMAGT